MHLEFRVKPINDKKDTYWTSPTVALCCALPILLRAKPLKTQKKDACLKQFLQKNKNCFKQTSLSFLYL